MKTWPIIISIILIILTSCTPEHEIIYGCADGQVSSTKITCDEIASDMRETMKRYVCFDGSIVESAGLCVAPESKIETKTVYVCPDNTTTEERNDCKIVRSKKIETTISPSEKPTEAIREKVVILQSEARQEMRKGDLRDAIVGEVLNNGTKPCTSDITSRIYDKGGRMIGQELTIATPSPLNPKQKGSFEISWDPLDHKGYTRYELAASCNEHPI